MKKIKGFLEPVFILPILLFFFLSPILANIFIFLFNAGLLYIVGVEFTSVISFVLFAVAYIAIETRTSNLLKLIAISIQSNLGASNFAKNIIFAVLDIPVSVAILGVLEYMFEGVSCSIEVAFLFNIICAILNTAHDMLVAPKATA